MNTFLTYAVPIAVVVLSLAVVLRSLRSDSLLSRAESARRDRLNARTTLADAELVSGIHEAAVPNDIVISLIRAFEEALEVDCGKIRLEDRLKKDLSLDGDTTTDNADEAFYQLLKEKYGDSWVWNPSWETVGDVISGIGRQIASGN
ncbi:hypothetical protein Pr1d_51290 [Bythopirellula goksoeyrii]|uniref:Uncharacterized protein n=1 Tax=Bythopirellula goksoeyrii TaxID=1400387 RepID=A0A5B9QJ90_9BACT|nr:hypothetical protein Pr1d_51290 [Bythopirellula goksoeyrii]